MKTMIGKLSGLLLPSLIGLALSSAILVRAEAQDRCPNCPETPAAPVSFASMEKSYEKATQPKPQQLVGTWKYVMGAPIDDYIGFNLFAEHKLVGLNNAGFKNHDGSDYALVQISNSENEFENQPSLEFSISNLGSRKMGQGPYIGQFLDRSFCISNYPYLRKYDTGRDEIYRNATISRRCRLVSGRSDLMVCAYSISGEKWNVDYNGYVDLVIAYVGYKKVP